jgi:hypothetical protein
MDENEVFCAATPFKVCDLMQANQERDLSSDGPFAEIYDAVHITCFLTLPPTLTGSMDSGTAIYPLLLSTEPTGHITTELPAK